MKQYQLIPYPPAQPHDAAPETLKHGQPITIRDFIVYSEWSYYLHRGRWPVDDSQADVLVGDSQTRYRHWYFSAYGYFLVSNTVSRADPDHSEKFTRLPEDVLLRFVDKEVIE